MESLVKSSTKLSFKEFNKNWLLEKGGHSYSMQFRNKNRALDVEGFLRGLNFVTVATEHYADWDSKLRKNFNLRVNPKNKWFHRTSKVIPEPNRYKNIYDEKYFNNFCFKFVIIEKKKSIKQ